MFQGLSLEVEKYLPVVTSISQMAYLNRSEAELDTRYKQLIPYVLLICHDRILRYQRGKKGQETRLHGLYSVGIGGHISEEDHGLFSTDRGGYQEGMRRELMEEVAVEEEKVKEAAVAVINDDSTEVGQVHFGVVHVMQVADESVASRRSGIASPEFIPIAEAVRDTSGYDPGPAFVWRIWNCCSPGPLLPASQFRNGLCADHSGGRRRREHVSESRNEHL